jgi:photosystem II stability/assembly factor-like uncharacterized protein
MRRAAGMIVLVLGLSARALAQESWETFGPPLYQVNALATAADDFTVYAAAGDYSAGQSAIFLSPDGGNHWNTVVQAASGEFYSDLLVNTAGPPTIYAGAPHNDGTTKLYASTDGGSTWNLGQTIPIYCVPSFASTGTAQTFVACGTHFYRSSGSPPTWEELTTPFTEATRLAAGPSGLLVAYGPTRIFRSTNAGSTWTVAGSAPSACAGLNALRVDPSNASVLVAGTGLTGAGGFVCGGIYRSVDGGASWAAGSLSGVYVTDVVIDPGQSSSVFASAGYAAGILPRGGVYRSEDGGRNWSSLQLPVAGAVRLALAPHGGIIYAATSLGVYERSVETTVIVSPRGRPIPHGNPPRPRAVGDR